MSTLCQTCCHDLYQHFNEESVISTEYHTFVNADLVLCVFELPLGVYITGQIKKNALTQEDAEAKAYKNALQQLNLLNANVCSFPA